jgi:hypothetical protein
MAEDPPKGLLQWIAGKVGDKLGDRLLEYLVTLGLGSALLSWAVLARRWITNEACIDKPWCEVRGWSLGALIVVAVATTLAVIVLGLWLRRTRRVQRELKAVRKGASVAASPHHSGKLQWRMSG